MLKHTKKIKKSLFPLSFLLFLLGMLFFGVNTVKAADPKLNIKDPAYTATFVSQSVKDPVEIEAGESVNVVIKFKNIGTATWDEESSRFISAYTVEPKNRKSIFVNDNWESSQQAGIIGGKIKPGQIGELNINLTAPKQTGDYLEKFYLAAENHTWVEGSYFYMKIRVTSTTDFINTDYTDNKTTDLVGTDHTDTPTTSILEATSTVITASSTTSTLSETSSTTEIVDYPDKLTEEPRIRVGIWKPEDFVQFKSTADDYNVFDGTVLVGVLPKNYLGVLKFRDGQYNFKGGGLEFATDNYLRLAPVNDPQAIFTLLNYEHQVKWKGGSYNFNDYRGAMEFRLSDKKTMYVINDLLFEDYIAGIAEASNGAPMEYIKALAVAARSYAYFTQQNTGKHDSRNFDVISNTGDQLYLGVGNEILAPNVLAATKATRGQMITYNDEVVITPYFGHSNGKTRSYATVWGGSAKPWLVPVKCKYDKGLARFGHGVGMSQRDAAMRADKDKWDYLQIDKFYYTGTEIEKIYE